MLSYLFRSSVDIQSCVSAPPTPLTPARGGRSHKVLGYILGKSGTRGACCDFNPHGEKNPPLSVFHRHHFHSAAPREHAYYFERTNRYMNAISTRRTQNSGLFSNVPRRQITFHRLFVCALNMRKLPCQESLLRHLLLFFFIHLHNFIT